MNQIAEAPLHWRHEPTSIHQSLTPHVESHQRIHVGHQDMFLYLRAEQTLSVFLLASLFEI